MSQRIWLNFAETGSDLTLCLLDYQSKPWLEIRDLLMSKIRFPSQDRHFRDQIGR